MPAQVSRPAPQAPSPPSLPTDALTAGSGPRPVTAATARRCRLWERGTLLYEDPFGAERIDVLTADLTALTDPTDPTLDPRALNLRPTQTLTFIPV